jgi:protein-disulfide isomerase
MKAKIIILGTILSILGVFAFGVFYVNNTKKDSSSIKQTSNLYNQNSFTYGNENAKVHIVEFFDPACGACASFHFFLKDIIEKHPNDIKVTLRYAPFHKGSKYVAKILEASRKQGKFETVLEELFKKQSLWASHTEPRLDAIWTFLPQIENLNQNILIKDMKNPKISIIIDKDIADGKILKVKQTPTFFVNGKELLDFGSKQLEALINSEL